MLVLYLCGGHRYEERLGYIQTITNNKVISSYEEFCESVMHPLEMGSSQSLPASYSTSASRGSPHKLLSSAPAVSFASLLRSFALTSHHQQSPLSRQSHSYSSSHNPHPNLPGGLSESLSLKLPRASNQMTPPRPRSSTNEERILQAQTSPSSMSKSFDSPEQCKTKCCDLK